MRNAPEVVREIGVDDVRVATEQQLFHLYDCLLSVSPSAVSVDFRRKIGFEDRFQHQQRCRHADPIPHARDAQRPQFAVGFRYKHSSDWLWPVSLLPERKRQFSQPSLDPVCLDVRKILAVDARRALVRAALGIGMRQNVVAADLMGWTPPASRRRCGRQPQEGSMALELLAIDLGKRSFHLYGIDTDGMILSRKVSRAKLAEVVDNLAPMAIAMEACASAHYWARYWLAVGCEVRLINPRFVKPFVKGSKNDAVDAEAIFEAAMRPTMRFVPVKSTDQQDLQSLHRARDRLICQRTALISHTRGLLAEYGIVLPQGPWRFTAQAPTAIAAADLSDLARVIFGELLAQLDDLYRRVKKLDATMVALCRRNTICRRLAKLPGVGPVVATAIVAAVNDG